MKKIFILKIILLLILISCTPPRSDQNARSHNGSYCYDEVCMNVDFEQLTLQEIEDGTIRKLSKESEVMYFYSANGSIHRLQIIDHDHLKVLWDSGREFVFIKKKNVLKPGPFIPPGVPN